METDGLVQILAEFGSTEEGGWSGKQVVLAEYSSSTAWQAASLEKFQDLPAPVGAKLSVARPAAVAPTTPAVEAWGDAPGGASAAPGAIAELDAVGARYSDTD